MTKKLSTLKDSIDIVERTIRRNIIPDVKKCTNERLVTTVYTVKIV